MSHKRKTSFLEQSQPSEVSGSRFQVPSATPTNRAEYLAENPEAAQLQAAQITQITSLIGQFRPTFRGVLHELVSQAEAARQIGIAIIEFEETLPGKKLTEDFWQQLKPLFIDSTGNAIERVMLEWFVKIARGNPDPINSIATALQWKQPLLLAQGDEEFRLEIQRPPQGHQPPPSPLSLLKERFNHASLKDIWERVRADQNFFPGGHLREDLRETLREELRPTFQLVDELRAQLEM